MLGFIVAIALAWYYFNFMENNTYLKNVTIYSIANFIVAIINQAISGAGFEIMSSIIGSIILGLIIVKIMEFAKSRTNSVIMFLIVTELCQALVFFCINFIAYKVL